MCGVNHSDFKSYMSYKAITNKSSKQYKIIHSDQITIGDDGLLYDGEYVGVALGSRYGNVGDKYVITFDDGRKFNAIKLDEKSDAHTESNCHHKSDGSLIEFVIDIDKAKNNYSTAIKMGNFDYADKFNGHVIKIEKVV